MFETLSELFNLVVLVFFKGAWIPFAVVLPWMFYRLYMDRIKKRWYLEQEWVFLQITVPQENEKSPLTFEQIFNQLHSIHASISFAEKYLEGRFQIWFVWEVTSIGGKIGNYVKILTKHRDTLEAAVYAQYPDAEITEVPDYFEHLPPYDPEASEYDVFAWHFKLEKEDAYPIRTYLDFEHAVAETIVDPIEGLWEELGKLSPHEMVVIQYTFRPINDDWKEAGYKLVKKLKGEPEALREPRIAGLDLFGRLLSPLFDIFIRPGEMVRPQKKEELPSLMLHLSEGEKEVISAVERSLAKLGYQTKIRCLYLAPKQVYNPSPVRTAIIGVFKSLGSTNLNSIKPDTDRWTRVGYWLLQNFEQPIVNFRLNWRKRHYMKMIRTRFYFRGYGPMILNTEEMATVLHFPRTLVTAPDIERVPVAKERAPADLPVVADFDLT